MIAKIKDINNDIYSTNVLAIKHDGWSSKVIVFDKSKSTIICLKMWFPHRCFFVIDSETKDWTKNRKWKGYEWIINDKKLMKHLVGGFLRKRKTVEVNDLLLSKQLAVEPDISEWNSLESQKNIDSLLDVSMGFHDAVIEKIEETESVLTIDFDTTWGCHIILKCSDIIEFNLNNLALILDSEIKLIDNYLHWYVTCGDPSFFDDKINLYNWFIKSKKIEWKIIII